MEKFIHVGRCDSTQDILKGQLALTHDDLTVSCEHQINGHGRGNNVWQDSHGTVCFSMTILPNSKITFTALEISLLITNFFSIKGKNIKVKWPNDLITPDGKKCGGVLIQNSGNHYYAGIGINLFLNNHSFGNIYEDSFPFSKKEWAQELSQFIRNNRYEKTEVLTNDWLKRCSHLNLKVKISERDQESIGVFIGLGQFGEAILENSQGHHHHYNGSLRLLSIV